MPYMLLMKVLPGFSSMRVPPRFIVLAILGTAVLLAYTLIGAVFVVLGNLVADFALTVADPRIRLA